MPSSEHVRQQRPQGMVLLEDVLDGGAVPARTAWCRPVLLVEEHADLIEGQVSTAQMQDEEDALALQRVDQDVTRLGQSPTVTQATWVAMILLVTSHGSGLRAVECPGTDVRDGRGPDARGTRTLEVSCPVRKRVDISDSRQWPSIQGRVPGRARLSDGLAGAASCR